MILVDSVYDLEYYNNANGAPCYCEQLVYASDLLLQGVITSLRNSYTVNIYVMTADGLTTYEDATPYFSYYIFNYNGKKYINIRLNSYSPAMCAHKCWILRIEINDSVYTNPFFVKYTQRYCQSTCCDVPRGITFTEDDVIQRSVIGGIPTITNLPMSECGKRLIRIEATFPCLDAQLGDYYGIPATTISGYATFSYKKITNITARIKQKPREITREIAYNCTLQRSSSFKPFTLHSIGDTGVFPRWKLNEFEAMFHADSIYVSDYVTGGYYQFAGGVIAEDVYKCWDMYKLNLTIQSCTIRQTFGCNESCDIVNAMTFIIPQNYNSGNFFDEGQSSIGAYANLLVWLRVQDGITEVTDVTADFKDIYAAIYVAGTGYIPTSFYYDVVTPRTRVFGTTTPVSPETACIMPQIGTITTDSLACTMPAIGEVQTSTITPATSNVLSYESWTVDGASEVVAFETFGVLSIVSENATLVATSPITYFANLIIGVIEPPLRPAATQTFTSSDNETIPIGGSVTIDTYGRILYSGYPTSYDGTASVVTITNLYFLL